MRCYVCKKETPPRQRYCDRCRLFFRGERDGMKRRAALREAYDGAHDGFRCHWSGVLLEERDMNDPFHLCFDHLVPVDESRLVVCADLFNLMKKQLGPDEFRRAIRELTAHRAGEPFDRDCIEFKYWRLRAPVPHAQGRGAVKKVNVPECVVCGRPPRQWSYYCERCRRFVWMHHGDQRVRARAMREAWSKVEGGFRCHYTGVILNDDDPWSPWFLTFDHSIPRDDRTIVVAASWVNQMKTALSEDEFWKVVKELDRYLRKGGEFDRDIVGFDYWRKARRERRRVHRS